MLLHSRRWDDLSLSDRVRRAAEREFPIVQGLQASVVTAEQAAETAREFRQYGRESGDQLLDPLSVVALEALDRVAGK